ncbi:hypothetical protein TREMEDRAFT_34976 [Tremella mesenterica DSM 1558]|uniref:uncharacterized protein n=1 Tax=Tremella mesenterica (strain ATCC 24925 / CBS 8224 / DSM 1558 / NBRC 9311 / NRRL Y-6157 / RJB 2259-6 / UBC 559-6) TaxID=578456 RepID=UPI00032BF014|nr:uncharacterized protein TREMEDRAFT_34976 [Tremella mesenterica DSM 1558]EIW66592.1 hypothetical protein TREMEDRAFT_34976 [Tremella mesenterica DSM 1558]
MQLPYGRPRLLEISDQSWCPTFIRQPVQDFLTFLWEHRLPLTQPRSPHLGVVDVLERVVNELEGKLRIVDCCSGAGGPMPIVERKISTNKPPIQVVMSDLYPHVGAWKKHIISPTSPLSYLSYPVDATRFPEEGTEQRHLRTFCLSFHHFNQTQARAILADAMRSSDGICIFELQGPEIGSFIMNTMIFPLSYILIPFIRPSLSESTWAHVDIPATIFFTYIIPIIPFILTFDGLISCYRTYTPEHITHLACLASVDIAHEMAVEDTDAPDEWVWSSGKFRHTWPFGYGTWVIGRRPGGQELE